jgi:hypothetical protein
LQKEAEEAARLGTVSPIASTSGAGTAISVSVIDEVTAFTQTNMRFSRGEQVLCWHIFHLEEKKYG